MEDPDQNSTTPWRRIYILILLFNALLIAAFYVLRVYFNAN